MRAFIRAQVLLGNRETIDFFREQWNIDFLAWKNIPAFLLSSVVSSLIKEIIEIMGNILETFWGLRGGGEGAEFLGTGELGKIESWGTC